MVASVGVGPQRHPGGLIEPGRVDTDIGVNARLKFGGRYGARGVSVDPLPADEVAGVVAFVLGRPVNVALDTVVVRPVAQAAP